MKLKVLSVSRRAGVSFKKVATGTPYDICSLVYMISIENQKTANSEFSGFGFETRELPISDPKVIDQFSELKLPCDVEVDVQPDPRNPSRNVVMGLIK